MHFFTFFFLKKSPLKIWKFENFVVSLHSNYYTLYILAPLGVEI